MIASIPSFAVNWRQFSSNFLWKNLLALLSKNTKLIINVYLEKIDWNNFSYLPKIIILISCVRKIYFHEKYSNICFKHLQISIISYVIELLILTLSTV